MGRNRAVAPLSRHVELLRSRSRWSNTVSMDTHLRALLLACLLVGGCDPKAFDEPRDAHDAAASDAEVPRGLDGGTAADAAEMPLPRDGGPTPVRDAEPVPSPTVDAGDPGTKVADGAVPVSCVRPDGRIVVSTPSVELARLATASAFESRALGPTIRLGDSDHVWTFSNARRLSTVPAPTATPQNHPYVAYDGAYQPWKSGPTMPTRAPWTLREPDAGSALPKTLLPLLPGESDALTLLPASFVRIGTETRGVLFALQVESTGVPSKVWLARLEDGTTQATRGAAPLFGAPPLFAHAARVDGEYTHLYACTPAADATPSRCVAGRVPTAKLDQPDAYVVRSTNVSGAAVWSSDLKSGTTMLENVHGDLTVTRNNYLQAFLAVYGEPGANHVVLRTSAQPYGPWGEPVRVALPVPSALHNLSIREHPALAQNCERRVVISYFAPTRAVGGVAQAGDAVLAAIDLD
jgi:hypothetical protein